MPPYNPPRSRNLFRKGQPFSFSRSKVDLFIKCPRCFYLDRVLGVDHPPGFPFSINSAVDLLLKKEFDGYRAQQKSHPLVLEQGFDFIPFSHPELDEWRENFKGVRVPYRSYEFGGAVDDIWYNNNRELIVVDYKSTAGAEPIQSIDKDYHAGYKRQVEFYQWLLKKRGFSVSDLTAFVYCTGDNTQPAFNDNIRFTTRLITYKGNTDWVEPVLDALIRCVESDIIPDSGEDCDQCKYYRARNNLL